MNNQESVWKIGKIVGILIAIFLAILSINQIKKVFSLGIDSRNKVEASISVEGTGKAVTVPDIATISFTVTETAKTVAEAQDKATAKVNPTIEALKKAGIAEKDIKTTSYSINPHYEYQSSVCRADGACPPSKSIVTGYDVSQSTEITVRDLKKVGELFSLIGSKGVQNVYGPSFSVDNPDAVRAQARAEAITEAKQKAEILADQLGVRLVRVVSFSENGNRIYPLGMGMGGDMMTSSKVATPEISVGETDVSVTVNIVYEIR